MAYHFLEEATLADVAFEATGNTLSELFQSAAQAVIESMANPETVKPSIARIIELQNNDVEKLLFDFLEEIVFLKDRDAIVFHDVAVDVNENVMTLKATLRGDTIKPAEQELHQDVKAVTMHNYEVEKNDEWKTHVVLDI